MSGVSYEFDVNVSGLSEKLQALSDWDYQNFLSETGAILESGARRRISDEKTTSEGEAWPQWSKQYAKTRRVHHSLLQNEGDLLDSVFSGGRLNEAFVGSGLIYARSQFLGNEERGIPSRNPLGVSDEEASDIEALGLTYIEELLQ